MFFANWLTYAPYSNIVLPYRFGIQLLSHFPKTLIRKERKGKERKEMNTSFQQRGFGIFHNFFSLPLMKCLIPDSHSAPKILSNCKLS